MRTRLVNGIDIHRSSNNVFANPGLLDAEKRKIKTGLVIEIRKIMRSLGLTQKDVATRMGISQSKVSDMMCGDFVDLSEPALKNCLTRLRHDIELRHRESVLHLSC